MGWGKGGVLLDMRGRGFGVGIDVLGVEMIFWCLKWVFLRCGFCYLLFGGVFFGYGCGCGCGCLISMGEYLIFLWILCWEGEGGVFSKLVWGRLWGVIVGFGCGCFGC